MNLEELYAEVLAITNRPDLEAKTLRAIKSATLRAHQRDFWLRDEKEIAVEFTDANYLQSFNVREFLPDFRSLKYLRKALNGSPPLEIIDPTQYANYFGNVRTNVCYMAGEILHVRTSEPSTRFHLCYYSYPDLTDEGWNSWIAEEFPDTIIYQAAFVVLTGIGYQELATSQKTLADEAYRIMQRTAIRAEGD